MAFTPSELEAMQRADKELDNGPVRSTIEDIRTSKRLEREARLETMTPEQRRINQYARALYYRHREARIAKAREYYHAHKAERAAYYQANRAERLEYQKAYNDAKKAGRRPAGR